MAMVTLGLLALAIALLLVLLAQRPGRESTLLQQQLVEMRERMEALNAAQREVPLALADGRAEEQRTLGDLKERLAALVEATKRMEVVGTSVAAVQELLQVPKLRGTLGEVWLEDLLRHVFPQSCYEMQHGFRSGEKVDAVLRVGDRLVPIDAKFPLEACQRMLATPDGDAADRERRAFRRSLKARVDEIADKYIRPDEGTFDFAIMYIPAEGVYYEAVVRGETLLDDDSFVGYAIARRVIPVSPHTFYAYLAAVLHGLRGLEVERRALEIRDSLAALQQQFARFAKTYTLVGTHLERAAKQYSDSERQISKVNLRLEAITGIGSEDEEWPATSASSSPDR